MITKIVGALALMAEYPANQQYHNLSITGGHQHVEEEFFGVVGAVGAFWIIQSSCNYEGAQWAGQMGAGW
jgi:hypothetical protein